MAFTTGITGVPGYPQPLGEKYITHFDRTGPASYTTFSSPSTGGDTLNASDIGFGGFDNIDVMVDTTGQIQAYVMPGAAGYGNAVPSVTIIYYSLVTATVGGKSQTAGTQIASATNLSTFSWRFEAMCV